MKFSRNSVGDRLSLIREEAEERDAARRVKAEGIPRFDGGSVSREALERVSKDTALAARLAVIGEESGELRVIVYSTKLPKAIATIRALENKGYKIIPAIATMSELERVWKNYKAFEEQEAAEPRKKEITAEVELDKGRLKAFEEGVRSVEDARAELTALGENPPTSELIATILGLALVLDASDAHFEYQAKAQALLRYRIDGVLKDIAEFSAQTMNLLVSRVKLLAGLKLNIRDASQDGRFTIKSAWGDIEVRASVVPAEYGEALVLRVLNPRTIALELETLGFREDDRALALRELTRPNGMILITGPTGSGKTTTLYAFLKEKYAPELKIITIEDPIEYHLKGIEQTQVDAGSGYTFASGLRSILRQDPDIILVGEIRDLDTAQMGIHAALTGHLVFSTLHTNNAAGAIPRLIDLGVKPNVIGSALALVVAQRLVRRLCESCREEVAVGKELQGNIDVFLDRLPGRVSREGLRPKLYRAKGCKRCLDGYRGRIAVAEFLELGDGVRALIKEGVSERDVEETAVKKQGMVRMQEDGLLKALAGITTLEEIERATGPIVW